MRQNIIRNDNFWEMACKNDDSWTWKSIMHVRDEVMSTTYNAIGPGIAHDITPYLAANGKIASSLIYEVLRRRSLPVAWGKFLWSGLQCKRWSFIVWLALRERLYTRHRLYLRGVCDTSLCALCGLEEETEAHLWMRCTYVADVAQHLMVWMHISHWDVSLQGWMDWFDSDPRQTSCIFQTKLLMLCSLVYNTWKAQNRVVFGEAFAPPLDCARSIISLCKDRMRVKCRPLSHKDNRWLVKLGV